MLSILSILGPQGIVIAVVVSLLGAAGGGAYTMHRLDNATKYYEQVKQLEELNSRKDKRIADMMTILAADADQSQKDQTSLSDLQRQIDEVKIINPNSVCFTKSESDQLRGLYAPSGRQKRSTTSHTGRH